MAADSKASPALDLKILSNELATVSDWYVLGLKLGLRPDQLRAIQSDNPTAGVERWKPEMLDKWLRTDSNASWENVMSALQSMGEDAVAKRITQKYVQAKEAVTGVGPTTGSDEFIKRNLSMIKRKFGNLLLFVHTKFQKELNKEDFVVFLLSVLPAETMECVPQSSDLEEIFRAITSKKLWTFLDYYLLEQIIEQFWENDEEMVRQMEQYKKDLSGYKTATKLKDHIAAALQLDAEALAQSVDDSGNSPSPETKYDPKYFRKLSVKLDGTVADYSMNYLDHLWKSLQLHLRLPPLALLLDTIHEGCICVTWLIPAHLVPQCIERARQPVEFFERFPILRVTIDDKLVYEEKPIESEGKEIHEALSKEKSLHGTSQRPRQSREYTLDTAEAEWSQSGITSQQQKAIVPGEDDDITAPDPKKRKLDVQLAESGCSVEPPKKDCAFYKLLGECHRGKECEFQHAKRADTSFTAFVPIRQLPTFMALHKHPVNLEDMGVVDCVSVPQSEKEVKIVAVAKAQLELAEQKLKTVFAQHYPKESFWCYFHTKGVAEVTMDSLFEFREHHGQVIVPRLANFSTFTMCLFKSAETMATVEQDTSLKQRIMSTTTALHHVDISRESRELPILMSKDFPIMTEKLSSSHQVRDYNAHMRERLQETLEWFCIRDPEPGKKLKLEARLGNVLWLDLPDDIVKQSWKIQEFREITHKHKHAFNTCVDNKSAEKLLAEFNTTAQPLQMLDLKLTTFDKSSQVQKLDIRLKIKGEELELIEVKQDETKLVVFDLLCLHRQHDMRISLSCFGTVPLADPQLSVVQEVLKTLTFSKSESFTVIPFTTNWTIHFIRYKKKRSYILDEKYLITVTSIKNTKPNQILEGQQITIDLGDVPEHTEVELRNMMWESIFGKDINLSPDKVLSSHLSDPVALASISSKLAANIPNSWDSSVIMEDFEDFYEHLNKLNEALDAHL